MQQYTAQFVYTDLETGTFVKRSSFLVEGESYEVAFASALTVVAKVMQTHPNYPYKIETSIEAYKTTTLPCVPMYNEKK
jgi:hypothetical protein